MFTVRLENIKIRQDLSNDEVAKIAYTKYPEKKCNRL